MSKREATIRDIALKLNISVSTVSRAIRDMPEVKKETRKLVLDMAKSLDYEPNKIAQGLRIKKTNTIGVIVPAVTLHFFSSIISGIQETANKLGYNVMFCQSNESFETEKANIHTLLSSRVDGLLISLSRETNSVDHLVGMQRKNIPLVLFDRVFDDINTAKVMVDDYEGAFSAVEYLLKTGCKRVAYLAGPRNLSISNHRLEGYKDALKKNKIVSDPELISHCEHMEEDAEFETERMLGLKVPPDAIFCFNDPVAIKSMEVIKQKGLKIPDDISVMGFTNEPIAAIIEPSLTTVSQPSYEMGKAATKLIVQQIESKEPLEEELKILQTTLIIRNSTKKVME